jgi:hypothetical protein
MCAVGDDLDGDVVVGHGGPRHARLPRDERAHGVEEVRGVSGAGLDRAGGDLVRAVGVAEGGHDPGAPQSGEGGIGPLQLRGDRHHLQHRTGDAEDPFEPARLRVHAVAPQDGASLHPADERSLQVEPEALRGVGRRPAKRLDRPDDLEVVEGRGQEGRRPVSDHDARHLTDGFRRAVEDVVPADPVHVHVYEAGDEVLAARVYHDVGPRPGGRAAGLDGRDARPSHQDRPALNGAQRCDDVGIADEDGAHGHSTRTPSDFLTMYARPPAFSMATATASSERGA